MEMIRLARFAAATPAPSLSCRLERNRDGGQSLAPSSRPALDEHGNGKERTPRQSYLMAAALARA